MVQSSTRAWNALRFAKTFSREAAGNSSVLFIGTTAVRPKDLPGMSGERCPGPCGTESALWA